MEKMFKKSMSIMLAVMMVASIIVIPTSGYASSDNLDAYVEVNFDDGSAGAFEGVEDGRIVTVAKDGNAENKALKFGKNAWKEHIKTGIDMKSENTYEISFSIYAENLGTQYGVFFGKAAQKNILLLNSADLHSNLCSSAGPWAGDKLFSTVAQTWIDVKIIINASTNGVIATYTDGTNSKSITGSLSEDLDASTIYLWNSVEADTCYIDDVVIKNYGKDKTVDFENGFTGGFVGLTDGSIETVEKDGNTNNKALKFGGNGWNENIDTGIDMTSENTYEISFSIYAKDLVNQYGVFFGKATGKNILLFNNTTLRTNLSTSDNAWGGGTIFETSANTWIDVNVIIDASTDIVVATYTDGTNIKQVTGTLSESGDFSSLYLWNNNANATCYIDDVKIINYGKGEDDGKIDFENGLVGGFAGVTVADVKTVAKDGNASNKALKFGKAWSGNLSTGIDMTSENIYEISFSIYADNLGTQYGVFFGNVTKNILLLSGGNLNSGVGTNDGPWAGQKMFTATEKTWIDVNVTINALTNKITATYTDGTNSNSRTGTLSEDGNFSKLYLWNSNAADTCYIDDVAIINRGEAPTVEKIEIDFEDGKYDELTVASNDGLGTENRVANIGTTERTSNAFKLGTNWTKLNTGIGLESEGTYKLSFSIYSPDKLGNYCFFMGGSNCILRIHEGSIKTDKTEGPTDNAWGGRVIGTTNGGNWIDVAAILDYKTGLVKVTAIEGANTYTGNFNLRKENVTDYNIFTFYDAAPTAGGSCYIDNIVVTEADAPVIDVERVTMLDENGKATGKNLTDVLVAVDKIALDFGFTKLKSSSLQLITLEKDGQAIDFTPSVNGGVITLDLNEALKPNTTYVLTVDSEISNVYGETLGTDYVHTFTTGEGEFNVNLDGLYSADGLQKLTQLSELTPGAKIIAKFNYENSTENSQPVTCIIGYYDVNDRLVASEIGTTVTVSELNGEESAEFTVPNADISYVKLFAWNNITSIMPVGGAINPFAQ